MTAICSSVDLPSNRKQRLIHSWYRAGQKNIDSIGRKIPRNGSKAFVRNLWMRFPLYYEVRFRINFLSFSIKNEYFKNWFSLKKVHMIKGTWDKITKNTSSKNKNVLYVFGFAKKCCTVREILRSQNLSFYNFTSLDIVKLWNVSN